MTFRKHLGQFLIVLMLLAQLALAQHATVHFLEDQYQTGRHQDHGANHSDKQDKSKLCQICVSAKELGHLLTPVAVSFITIMLTVVFSLSPLYRNLKQIPAAFYSSRAPPSSLC